MKQKIFFVLVIIHISITGYAQIYIDTLGATIVHIKTIVDSNHFKATTPANGWAGAWDLHWGPDNQLWFSNNNLIQKYNPVNGQVKTLLKLPKGYIMGITTHSNFSAQPYVYAVIDTNRYYAFSAFEPLILYRFTYDFTGDTLKNRQFLLQWDHITEHSGGRVMFGKDSKVYVTTAEYDRGSDTLFNNSGKILRVNPDGTVPADNPKQDFTYSLGHRNPQGIVQTPNGNIISSEYGNNFDELNLIKPNKNYGWCNCPVYSGYDGFTCMMDADTCNKYHPMYSFPIDVGENPPSGIDYYNHPAIPEFKGIIEAVTGVRNGNGYWSQGIIVYNLNEAQDSVVGKKRYLGSKLPVPPSQAYGANSAYGRIRDVCSAPDGKIYFIGGDRSATPSINVIYNPTYIAPPPTVSIPLYRIYPNPTTGLFKISIDSSDLQKGYAIFSSSGSLLEKGTLTSLQTSFNITRHPDGLYFVKIYNSVNKGYKILKLSSR